MNQQRAIEMLCGVTGAREVSLTIVPISVSLPAVFMPVFFMPG